MTVSTMRLAALFGIGGGVLVAGCQATPAVGVAGMTPIQMDSAVAAMSWVGCDTVARAAVGGGTTNVEICAAPNARLLGPSNAPAGDGAPVARMRNLGTTRVENRWKLQPKGTYSIWLYSGTAGALYRIRGGGLNIVGTYVGCDHPPETTDKASFGTCQDNPHQHGPSMRRNGSSSGPAEDGGDGTARTLLSPLTGPAWISCTEGCCTTDAN